MAKLIEILIFFIRIIPHQIINFFIDSKAITEHINRRHKYITKTME